MKQIILYILISIISLESFSQSKKLIQKSWIRSSVQNLSDKDMENDSLYTRYTFDKSALYISFYPGWDDFKQNWVLSGDDLTIGFDTYKIEELTDSSLTIALQGFRRVKFLSEDYLSKQEKYLILIDTFNNKPLYKANNYITPRYSKRTSLYNLIQKNLEGYNIKQATHFLATFIVNEKGRIENVQIINGITSGFDNEVIQQLKKTSGDWIPANFKAIPIQTQMFYEIKYLGSLTPFNSGRLN